MSDDRTIPNFSERLWSEEVGMADPAANFNAPPVLAYTFGNRTLYSDVNTTLYGQPTQIPALLDVHFATRQAQRIEALGEVTSENIITEAVVASSQAQLCALLTKVDELVPNTDTQITSRQGQRGTGTIIVTSENLSTNSTVTARQSQTSVVRVALNGVLPPVIAALSTGQGQYAAAVVAIDGIQPGSDAPIPLGGTITTFKLENTSTSPLTNAPFTMGQVFAAGHLPASGANISLALPDNTPLTAQLDVKALHPDGSVRHALISGVMPALAASSLQTVSIRRAAASPGLPSVALPSSLPSATLVIGGASYTASCAGVAPDTWFAGPCASDYVFNVPFTGASGPHPFLTAQFSVRRFSTGHVRVDYVVEHCKAYLATADITYDVTLAANGATVYSKTGLVHTPQARWKKTFWYGQAPALHVRHDTAYLIASKQVPNYDQSVTIPESILAGWATDLASGKFEPMQFGRFNAYMPTTGGRPDIGIMPDSHVATILSMDRRAKAITLAAGDIGGSWPACLRDDSAGPGRGMPLSVMNFPYASNIAPPGDCQNPKTGKNEKLPVLTTATQGVPDTSHQPGIYYLPYLLTGDFFYLEGLHFFASFNNINSNPYYREFDKALVKADQVRGQAWIMRTMAEAAAITPENHPLKAHCRSWFDTNIDWFNRCYTDGPSTDPAVAVYYNRLGVITNGYALAYPISGGSSNGMAPWQDDFFASAVGHGAELLEHTQARRLLLWKGKFQIERMLDPAVCVQDSCSYSLGVKTNSGQPVFGTLAECFAFTVAGTTQQYACNTTQRLATYNQGLLPGDISGYPSDCSGYPANYQPGLAYAVDAGYPNGLTAWAKFQARPTKPNYGLQAQFAIVPRSAQSAKAPLLSVTVSAKQGQTAFGAIALTATPSIATARQAQKVAATARSAADTSATSSQVQSTLGATSGANQMVGTTKQAQTVAGAGSSSASTALNTRHVQRTTAVAGPESSSSVTSSQGQHTAAAVQTSSPVVTTKQGQRASGTLALAVAGTLTTKQAQHASLFSGAAASTTVSYTASTADIPNPERGFYVHLLHTGDFSSANLNVYKAQNMRLVLYQAYLTAYKTVALDATFLNAFQSRLDAIRSAGMKTVLRFAYTSTDTADATLSRIQGHLDQLAPYLAANDDVILGMQCGFVGQWGEFQGSNNFGTDSWPPNVTSAQRAARKAVIDKALSVMPSHRFVQVRQPWIKIDGYGGTPLNASTAFAGTSQARLGHFNDCFLAGSTDSGTYWQQASEETFLAADTVYVPMGGETCSYNEPRSSGTTAIAEMTRFHWTFVNSGYQDQVIQSWKDSGDYATISKRLGYRLALTTATLPTSGTSGASIAIVLNISNSGFAAPISGRAAYLVLRNTSTSVEFRVALATDPRTWLAGATTNISETVRLPAGMAAGSYALFLALPDPDAGLAGTPGYAIQLANTGTWESGTGYNALNHTMTVS